MIIDMSTYSMEACAQMSYDLIFHGKQGPIFSYHILNITKICETYFGSFLRQTGPLQPNPQKDGVTFF